MSDLAIAVATTACGWDHSLYCYGFFCKLSPLIFLGEEDPVLVEKWEEPIEEHLNALDVQNGVTCVGLVNS